jgi:hypothetical protein
VVIREQYLMFMNSITLTSLLALRMAVSYFGTIEKILLVRIYKRLKVLIIINQCCRFER